MRVADYAHFALNKLKSLSITLWYNAWCVCDSFHTSSTKPNPCTNLSHNHNVHSQLEHSSVNFMNIKSRYSLPHISREMYIFLVLNVIFDVWRRSIYLSVFSILCAYLTYLLFSCICCVSFRTLTFTNSSTIGDTTTRLSLERETLCVFHKHSFLTCRCVLTNSPITFLSDISVFVFSLGYYN